MDEPAELPEQAPSPEALRTEERYARPEADRLNEAALERHRTRRTGATAAAFFDLDKTVIARSSTLVMGRPLYRDGLISPVTVLRSMYAQAVYQLAGADHARMEQMRAAALEMTLGWEAERVRAVAREAVEQVIAPLVYAEAMELIAMHRARGEDVWLVTSSGEEVVEPFAEHLGVGDWIATRSGVDDDGRYDGTLEFYAYGRAKATALRQVAEVRGYDLTACSAYSDSVTDLPMLSVVGNPVAVNPDRELRAAATALDWEVRDFGSPVSLRSRLPEVETPDPGALALGLGLLAGAALAWRLLARDD